MSYLNSFEQTGTNAGSSPEGKQYKVSHVNIMNFGSVTTTVYISPNRRIAESNASTSAGVSLNTVSKDISVRALREISGLTWEQLSNLFSVSRRSLHHWDAGNAMSGPNLEKLGRIINAVSSIGTREPDDIRRFLLTPVSGKIPIDLLKEGRFGDFSVLKDFFISNPPRKEISIEEKVARSPISPAILVDARFETVHTEKRKIRPIKPKKVRARSE